MAYEIPQTYDGYWTYVHFVSTHCYDVEDLREAISHQKLVTDSTILQNHTQHPCYTPDTALYLDALKLFKQRNTSK